MIKNRIVINLTDDQVEQLMPLFQEANDSDGHGMVMGQFFEDGARVAFVDADSAVKIQKITGSRGTRSRAGVSA